MNIKDRFTIYSHIDKNLGFEGIIVDNKTQEVLTPIQAEYIFQREYGAQYSKKTAYQKVIIDNMFKHIDYYNDNCEVGFEISTDDLINVIPKEWKQKN